MNRQNGSSFFDAIVTWALIALAALVVVALIKHGFDTGWIWFAIAVLLFASYKNIGQRRRRGP